MPPKTRSKKVQKKKKVGYSTDPPFPSPPDSVGPDVPSPRSPLPREISQLARSGLPSFSPALPIGFPAEYNMCYRNAVLSLLMNITPFVEYLNHFATQTLNTVQNVLVELGEMATAYWSSGSDEQRRDRLGGIIDKLWAHLLSFNNDDMDTVGWGPFLDSDQNETQQDAGDFLENLLTNGDAECRYIEQARSEYNAMVEATFEVRTACAGNCDNVKTRRAQLDRTRLWTVNIDHSKGPNGGTLEDAIRTTLTNEIDLTCPKCKRLSKEGKPGRIWYRVHDMPEILFIRLARFEHTKSGKAYRKCNNEVLIPDILDLTPYLEASAGADAAAAAAAAKFRLAGTINHAGTMHSGHFVSHVRSAKRTWFRLDDESVTASSIATLNHDPARLTKTHHRFSPYLLAYTRIADPDGAADDDDHDDDHHLSPDPPAPAKQEEKPEVRFRFRVRVALHDGQTFTMTRRLRAFSALHDQELSMQMDVVDARGCSVLSVDPIVFRLVREALGNARGEGEGEGEGRKTPSLSPGPGGKKEGRSRGEEGARVGKGKGKGRGKSV